MAYQAYAEQTILFNDDVQLSSCSGVQQGDPCGPALFCFAIKGLVEELQSDCTPWYLDDGVLIGDPLTVKSDLERIIDFAETSGLHLSPSKCEVYAFGGGNDEDRKSAVATIRKCIPEITRPQDLSWLGAPLLEDGVPPICEKKAKDMTSMCSRLPLLSSQQGAYILRHSLSASRVIYLLRCSPLYKQPEAPKLIDDVICNSLECIVNLTCDARFKIKATLPIKAGGLGFRLPSDLALPCYAASVASTRYLVMSLLPQDFHEGLKHSMDDLEDLVKSKCDEAGQLPSLSDQAAIDEILWSKTVRELENSSEDDFERARLRASREPLSQKWVDVLPSEQVGTLLSNQQFRVAVGLKLGARLCLPHHCVHCHHEVSSTGEHGLSCTRSQGRHYRHSTINEEIKRALIAAEVPAVREPQSLFRDDGRRPDGMTMVPWEKGKCLVWDATVVDTLAASYVEHTAKTKGAAAHRAEEAKRRKYQNLGREFLFLPLAFETLGSASEQTFDFLEELSRRLVQTSGDLRAGKFFLQRLSLCLVRGNAASVLGTMQEVEELPCAGETL